MWLYLPSSISRSSVGPEDSTCPSDSLFQMLAASATANGKLAQPASWRREWKTGALSLLRSGVMSNPSLANSSVTAWLESLGVFPAPICPSRVSEPASTESTPDFGSSTSASFARCGPDGSLSKMSPQFSLFPVEESYSEGLPDSGSMRSGHLEERPMSEPRINGNGSSSSLGSEEPNWNTPSTEDNKTDGQAVMQRYGGGAMRNCDQRLRNQSAAWHTPHGMSGMDYSGKVGGGGEFAKQAANWPTPKENDGGTYSGVRNQERPFTTSGLSQSVRNWPSPRSEDSQVCGNHPGAMDSLGGGSASLDHPYQRKRQRSEPCAGGRGKPIGRRISLDHTSIPRSGGRDPKRVRRMGSEHGYANLADDVTLWSTPDSQVMNDGADVGKHRARQERLRNRHHNGNGAGTPLTIQTQDWGKDGR